MILALLGLAVVGGVAYAVKHHITVAQAKAEAEALLAKVKAEVVKVDGGLSADYASVVAKVKNLIAEFEAKK